MHIHSAHCTCETLFSHALELFGLPPSCTPPLTCVAPLDVVTDMDSEPTVTLPRAVFAHMLNKSLGKHVRPPTKKHRGKKLRESKPIMTTMDIWQEQFATNKGLPMEVS